MQLIYLRIIQTIIFVVLLPSTFNVFAVGLPVEAADTIKLFKQYTLDPLPGDGIPIIQNDSKADIAEDYAVLQWVRITSFGDQETAGDEVRWLYTGPDGSTFEWIMVWSATSHCWVGNTGCLTIGELLGFGFRMYNITSLEQVGLWNLKVTYENRNTIIGTLHEENFQIVAPEMRKVGGDNQKGLINETIIVPVEIQLLKSDGFTPATNKTVRFEISSTPRKATGMGITGDYNTPPTVTYYSTFTDSGGYARAFVKLGDQAGTYVINVTSPYVELSNKTFNLTALESEEVSVIDPEKNLGADSRNCAKMVSNPINIVTGNKYQQEQDYSPTGISPLYFTRYYNSLSTTQTSLAYNWRHSFDRTITTSVSGSGKDKTETAKVTRPDGKVVAFDKVESAWVADSDIDHTLVSDTSGWIYKENNTTERYDATGKLISITYLNGRTLQLDYNATTVKLSTVSDQVGGHLAFSYDLQGRLESVRDHVNREWVYSYDAQSNLKTVQNPDLSVKQYHYEDGRFPHALTGITDERSIRYATYAYDSAGLANASYHAGNAERVDILYNSDGTRTVTNSRNQLSTYTTSVSVGTGLISKMTGPGCSTCSGSNTEYVYDRIKNKVHAKKENGVTTQYGAYENRDRPGYIISAAGTPDERRIGFAYDPRFKDRETVKYETSEWFNSSQSEQNNQVIKAYDDFGNTTKVTLQGYAPGPLAISRTFTYEYNGPLNQLSQINGPRSDVNDITTFEYYPNDAIEGYNRARLKRVVDPVGIVWRDNIQYTATGKFASEVRPNGLTVSYAYYAGNDRLEKVTESASGISKTTRWTYLKTGEVETITLGYGTTDATTTTYVYDDARRLIQINDGSGNYIKYTLDTEGNREKEEIYDFNNILKKQLIQTFDIYNRLDTVSQANDITQVNEIIDDYDFSADGTLDRHNDGKSTVTDYNYDSLKRLTTSTQDLGGTEVTTQNALSKYEYNVHGRITSVTDPINNITAYSYDDLGNLFSQYSRDSGSKNFTHDEAGNIREKRDSKNQLFTYNYDAADRLTGIDAPGTDDDITYSYDTCTNGNGRLCRVSIGDGLGAKTVNYSYDPFGNMTQHQAIRYTYDDANRVKSITYPSGAVVTYSYDSAGNVDNVQLIRNAVTSPLASHIAYTSFGPMVGLDYGNGLSLGQPVDSAYRIDSIAINGVMNFDNYVHDINGNITQRDDAISLSSTQYNYDALNRLDNSAAFFGSRDYRYDKNGNRVNITDGTESFSYSTLVNSNKLGEIVDDNAGSASNSLNQKVGNVSHDNNGNITAIGTWTYTYTTHDRLLTVSDNSLLKGSYTYNGLGQRANKRVGSVSTNFIYGLNGELLYETDGTNAKEYIYLNGQPLAVIDNSTIYYSHNDHLGTPLALSNHTGTVVWRAQYVPFGAASVNPDADNDGTVVTFNLRFPGQYYDAESGLHYNYLRYYDPSTGRYVTSDPIGLQGGLNTYGYAKASPVRYTDIFGLETNEGTVTVPCFICLPPNQTADGTEITYVEPISQGISDSINDTIFWGTVIYTAVTSMCSDSDDEDEEDDNCEALYQSTLRTCDSLTGRKKFQCYEAARINRDQCYQERNK